MQRNLQIDDEGNLQHLLTIEGIPRALLLKILDTADSFVGVTERDVKKVPLLRGKSVFNIFFEPSTRTRTTFEIAAKRLSADVINLNVGVSSTSKGETLLDTVANLSAMHADMFIVRHATSGAPHLIARHVAPGIHVINAGDGRHAHPTQALLDMYTIRHYKKNFTDLRVAVVGDLLHSRVARSQIHALTTLGRAGSARRRPKNIDSARRRNPRRASASRHGARHQRLRRGDDVALTERAHERRATAKRRRVFQVLRPHAGKTCVCETRCDRHASRPDESRRGN